MDQIFLKFEIKWGKHSKNIRENAASGCQNEKMTDPSSRGVVFQALVDGVTRGLKSESWYLKASSRLRGLGGYTFCCFYKKLHFRPPEPQIFENRSNLASNSRASNRKFLATFELPNGNSKQLSSIFLIFACFPYI